MSAAVTPSSDDAPMMRSLSVTLLECDHVDAEIREVAGDYGDMFADLFGSYCPEIVLDRIDVVGGEALPAFGAHNAIVIRGSRHSATDDLPWIHALTSYVREAHEHRVPLVGICFGHQLIAHALARVGLPQLWMTSIVGRRLTGRMSYAEALSARVQA